MSAFLRALRWAIVLQWPFLLATAPLDELLVGGPIGQAARDNTGLWLAGCVLLQALLPAALAAVARRAPEALRDLGVFLLAAGPWLVAAAWHREPFDSMPRSSRLLGVLALSVAAALVAIGLLRVLPRRGGRALDLAVATTSVLALVGGLVGARTLLPRSTSGASARPNLVLFVADAVRADALALARPTPHLDLLARAGVDFDAARAVAPTSVPTHASLLTGLGVDEHAAFTNRHGLDPAVPRWVATLREGGYRTVGLSANQLLSRDAGFAEGFDHYWSAGTSRLRGAPVPLGIFAVPAVELFLEAADRDVAALQSFAVARALPSPFFLFVQLLHAHEPYQDRAGWAGAERRAWIEGLQRDDVWPDASGHDETELAHFRARYLGAVHTVDAVFGRLRATVERVHGSGRTSWIFTSDHGENLGEHAGAEVGRHEGSTETVLAIPMRIERHDGALAGTAIATLTGQERVAELARWLVEPSAGAPRLRTDGDLHFALSESAYVLYDDSLKVVWERERPEREAVFHRWREDPFDRRPAPVGRSARALELTHALALRVTERDLVRALADPPGLTPERRRRLKALGYVD